MNLFQQAATKGNPMALFNIGALYADGLGVKKDGAQAREWFEKAAALGNEPAITRLAHMDAECGASGPPALRNPPGYRVVRPPVRKC
jgi:TPR repeat protein